MDPRTEQRRRVLLILLNSLHYTYCLAAAIYYEAFVKHEVSRSTLSGEDWMQEALYRDQDSCLSTFRMEPHVLLDLCEELETNYGLRESNISVVEKVGIFLYILGRGRTNRDAKLVFRHSGDTISRAFHEVLEAIVGRKNGFMNLAYHILQPRDPTFSDIPAHIRKDPRYYPYFKDCIGAIDGTHVDACIRLADQGRYCNRKRNFTFNVLAACDFDMLFTFVGAGYEGSAHDSKVLNHALENNIFPLAPRGKYYFADKGYGDREGFLIPYHNDRYHLTEFNEVAPESIRELFNQRHSSLRSCIERSFGVLKQKWRILSSMPSYEVETQVDITLACFTLHNFIRIQTSCDYHFYYATTFPKAVPEDPGNVDPGPVPQQLQAPMAERRRMRDARNQIAQRIWNDRRRG